MIHGIYVRYSSKTKWKLFAVASTAEKILEEETAARQEAKKYGHDKIEIKIRSFGTSFYIPEYLKDIKESAAAVYN